MKQTDGNGATAIDVNVKTDKLNKMLKCMLTDEQVKQSAEEMARAYDDLKAMEEEEKSVKEQFKSRRSEIETRIGFNQRRVRDKYEHRQVECERKTDYKMDEVTTLRIDTNEIIERRPLTPEEKQTSFV